MQEDRRNKYEKIYQERKYARLNSQQEAWVEISALPLGLDTEGTQNGKYRGSVTLQYQGGNFVDVNDITELGEGNAR